MKYCTYCGAQLPDDAKFCQKCGHPVQMERTANSFPENSFSDFEPSVGYVEGNSIVKCIVLTLITCGIYLFFWVAKLNDDINFMIGDDNAPHGGTVVFLTIITCGIYGLFWLYKMGQYCDRLADYSENRAILYVALGAVGLSVVSCALMQDTVNRTIGYEG